ncbi:MAG TPA: CarD family transcriptional regulator [Candidatus Babeliales bacterium]|nr:CarD family transcriptional regulator [Candidatus Babeliales bacterium]
MFSLQEKVVYPGHGVAQVSNVVEKTIGGTVAQFYELRLLSRDMTVLVPVSNVAAAGIRHLSSSEMVDNVFQLLAQPAKKITDHEQLVSSWNKRNKEYQVKLRTGSLVEISKIYRDLKLVALDKELSFGERTLLTQTEALLVEEISAVKNFSEDEAIEWLRSSVGYPRIQATQYSRLNSQSQ